MYFEISKQNIFFWRCNNKDTAKTTFLVVWGGFAPQGKRKLQLLEFSYGDQY